MNQLELRHLAEERILDAAALIAGGLTHDFRKLIDIAGLLGELNNRLAASARAAAAAGGPPGGAFAGYWGSVIQWNVASRYATKSEAEAQDLYTAVTHNPDGVLQWIRNFW